MPKLIFSCRKGEIEDSVIGAGTKIGKGCTVSSSVIGKNCVIGDSVTLDHVFLWDNTTVAVRMLEVPYDLCVTHVLLFQSQYNGKYILCLENSALTPTSKNTIC